ncbi:MAG: hypothetical protein HZC29_06235 [Thaumarchaeota archaeon]|nr:hypothetical protein [Nitrososphaerota archaeon]
MKVQVLLVLVMMVLSGTSLAFAHKTVTVGQYDIEVGWRDEPPLVSQQNAITIEISTGEGNGVSTGVSNAFRDLTATVKSGSVAKQLDILAEEKAGHYYAKIIPTQVGPLTIEFKGTINGVDVNEEINVEDVENINILAFPPTDASGLPDLAKIKNTLGQLQQDVAQLNNGQTPDSGKSYDYAVFAMGLGAAGVIIAVISLIKRK